MYFKEIRMVSVWRVMRGAGSSKKFIVHEPRRRATLTDYTQLTVSDQQSSRARVGVFLVLNPIIREMKRRHHGKFLKIVEVIARRKRML